MFYFQFSSARFGTKCSYIYNYIVNVIGIHLYHRHFDPWHLAKKFQGPQLPHMLWPGRSHHANWIWHEPEMRVSRLPSNDGCWITVQKASTGEINKPYMFGFVNLGAQLHIWPPNVPMLKVKSAMNGKFLCIWIALKNTNKVPVICKKWKL